MASWADYVTEDKMSKSGKTVADFLARVAAVTEGPSKRDVDAAAPAQAEGRARATRVEDWEKAYYEERVKQEELNFDSQSVRPYFEFNRVRDGLLDHHLAAVRHPLRAGEGSGVVAPEQFDSYDVFRGSETARAHPPRPAPARGQVQARGAVPASCAGVKGVQLPEGALVCNFADPAVHSPALLDHDDVVTLFHEFGHLMHHVLGGQQTVARLLGRGDRVGLRRGSEPDARGVGLGPGDAEAVRAAHRDRRADPRRAGAADARGRTSSARARTPGTRSSTRQLSLALHSRSPANARQSPRRCWSSRSATARSRYVEGTHFFASFGHLNGYSAMYYTYLWSLVIAKDLLGEFQRHGLLDEKTATRYRDTVLVPGGSRDAADLVKDFLGRPYGFEAFQEWLEKA